LIIRAPKQNAAPPSRSNPAMSPVGILGPREMSDLSPESDLKQTLSRHRRMTESDPERS
jgi:hypothetical protein